MITKPGHVIAAALRLDAVDVWAGRSQHVRFECPRCGGTSVPEGEDMECRECNRRGQ